LLRTFATAGLPQVLAKPLQAAKVNTYVNPVERLTPARNADIIKASTPRWISFPNMIPAVKLNRFVGFRWFRQWSSEVKVRESRAELSSDVCVLRYPIPGEHFRMVVP